MFTKAIFNTNEVSGSFWRPHDYMAHVPTAKVTASDNVALTDNGIDVSLSEEGIQLAATFSAPVKQAATIDISADNDDRDTVKKYVYNGIEGSVKLVDVAV